MDQQELRYRVLKILEHQPNVNQRELAKKLGISLGKANYCIKALIEKGLIKAKQFRNSQNKSAYAYLLTPKGIEEKAKITLNFLKYKLNEYEAIKNEIELLRLEAENIKKVTTEND